MVTHPDGSIWFVETAPMPLGRIDRNGGDQGVRDPDPNASLRASLAGISRRR